MTPFPSGQHPIKASARSPWSYGAGTSGAMPGHSASAALYVISRGGALFISRGCRLSPNCFGRSSSASPIRLSQVAAWPSFDQMVEKFDV